MRIFNNILIYKGLSYCLLFVWLLLPVTQGQAESLPQESDLAKTADQRDSSEEQAATFSPLEAVQHTVHINLDFQSFLLDEVLLDEEHLELPIHDQFALGQSKTFRILLERIISPNAP